MALKRKLKKIPNYDEKTNDLCLSSSNKINKFKIWEFGISKIILASIIITLTSMFGIN